MLLILFMSMIFIFSSSMLKPEYKIMFIMALQICWASLKYQMFINSATMSLMPNWLAFWMVLMVISSVMLGIMSSHDYLLGMLGNTLNHLFILMVMTLIFMMMTSNMIFFYILFELSVIPIFMIILGWGYQPERYSAAYSLFFYTVSCSMPLILTILIMNKIQITSMFQFQLSCTSMNNSLSTILSLSLILAFLVKFPVYGGHLWLPKAHVEAPVFGSMILAAILLKLAGVGITRFSSFYLMEKMFKVIVIFSILGMLMISLLCVKILDMKMIIAYSSVAHMSLVIASLMMQNKLALLLATFMMLTHAFSSSAAFYGVNLIYKISNSRSLMFNKGGLILNSSLSFFWMLTMMASMAAPPTINLFSEILCIGLIVSFFPILIFVIVLSVIASGGYGLIMYSNTQTGKFNWENSGLMSHLMIEKLIFFIHGLIIYFSIFLISSFI